ncbi:MAG: homoserine kinase [Actinobacteria bacterium]|nr:homoserine kinase [Actinomycetota bacterium]
MRELIVRAPASTANLGPGFDCAAAALDLWNELHVEPGDGEVTVEGEGAGELPRDADHLALRAFAQVAPPTGYRFRFVNRIPLERGLGASAATIAVGLVAASLLANNELSDDELLQLGLPLEGHPDNLAAALRGGVCLIWRNGAGPHTARIATDLPLAPVVVVPDTRVNTLESRDRLPRELPYEEATAAAAQAALLGAAIASGDANLLADAFHDRLHEPYRLPDAPVLAELRDDPVPGQQGVTLSGSGPTVVVWADKSNAQSVAHELEQRFPDARVLPLAIADEGAH